MDTLSVSVSTLNINIPKIHPRSNRHIHLPHSISSTNTKPKTCQVSNKSTTSPISFVPPLRPSSSQTASKPAGFHEKAASTGYAVALLDAARYHNVLELVERGVKRLSRWLDRNDPRLEKGEILLGEMVKSGKFDKHLMKLVKLLVQKCKVEILSQVLMEFRRIYDELTINFQLVNMMEKRRVLGIAQCSEAYVMVRQLAIAN